MAVCSTHLTCSTHLNTFRINGYSGEISIPLFGFINKFVKFPKTIFLVFKVHSCKSETLSVNSPTYDILELHSTLVRFYHNVYYKQRGIKSYGRVE